MKNILLKHLDLFIIIILISLSQPVISQVVDAGSDKSVCTNSTTLSAIQDGGVWSRSGNSIIVSPSSQLTNVNNLDPGPNTFTYTVGAESDFVIVTNNSVTAVASTIRPDNCISTANLIGTGGTGQWSLKYASPGVIIASTGSNTTSVSNLPFGNTIFVWTVNADGCDDSDEINITNNLPENSDGSDVSGCTSIFYLPAETPPVGGSGFWSKVSSPGTLVFDNSTSPGVTVTAPIGNSVIKWTINYDVCTSTKIFNITNNLPIPKAGDDLQVCRDTVVLGVNATAPLPGEHGIWSVASYQGEVFSSQSIINPTVTKLKQGISTFKWILSNAYCSAVDSMKVDNKRPSINAGPDITNCENTYKLAADNPSPNTGTWTCTNSSIIFSNSQSNDAVISNLVNNTYNLTWTVSNGFCTASDFVVIHTDFVPISAGSSSSACSDTVSLSGTAIPPSGSGYWTITFGKGSIDNSLTNITTARNISSISTFKWTIISGVCTFIDEISYVNQLPAQAITDVDKTVCSNQAFISANKPKDLIEYGRWTIEGSGSAIFENSFLYQTDVSNLKSGLNTFRWTIYNANCNTYDLINITNNSITTIVEADKPVCGTSSSIRAISSGGTGYWTSSTLGVVIFNSTSPTSAVSKLAFGINSFLWTRNDLGCTASDDVVITSLLPVGVTAGIDKETCENYAPLLANSPSYGTGKWSRSSGGGTIGNVNFYQTDVTGLAYGLNVYKWTVTYQSCSAYDEVSITSNKITVSAGLNQTLCNQSEIHLLGTIPTIGQTGVWSVIDGNGSFSNASLYYADVTSIKQGINTYNWTLTDSKCSNSSQVTITNNTPDIAKAGLDQIVCTNSTDIKADEVNNGIGSWSKITGGGNIQDPNSNNTSVNAIPIGLNTYRWTIDKNGCKISDDLNVTNKSVTAVIPNDQYNVCSPTNSTTLTANLPTGAGTTGKWTKQSLGSANIVSPNNYSTEINNLPNGKTLLRWTVSNASCTEFDEASIVYDYYVATAKPSGSANICANNNQIIGSIPPLSGSGKWTANKPAITFSDESSPTSIAQNIPLGTATLYWTITNNGCASQASFNLNNFSLTTDAGKDIVGCSDTLNLSAKALIAGESGSWTSNQASVVFSNKLLPNSSVSKLPVGTSVLTWTLSANGCSASDYIMATNNSLSISAGNDKTICGTSSSLLGSDPLSNGTGNWIVLQGTGILANPKSYNSSVSNLSNGNNIFQWTVVRNGCTKVDDIKIINDLYIAKAINPASVCIDEVLITATALPDTSGATGTWSTIKGAGIFDNVNANQTMVRGMLPGTNQYKWTVNKGNCTSYAIIDAIDRRLVVSAGNDQVTCVDNASLFATPLSATGIGIWTSENADVVISSPNSALSEVSNLSRGVNAFKWSVIDGDCSAETSVTITNNDFDTFAGDDQTVFDSKALMNAQFPGSDADGQWTLLNGNGLFDNYSNPLTKVTNLGYGINTFRWDVVWKNCTASDDVSITYNIAESFAGEDQNTCKTYATLEAEQPFMGTGSWSVVAGTGIVENPASYITVVNNILPGVNTFRWTVTALGTEASDDVTITNQTFSILAGTDQATCATEVVMDAESAGTEGSGQWYIYQGNGVFENNFDNQTHISKLLVGTNRFIWSVTRNGCTQTDTVTITHYQPTNVAKAGNDITLCDKIECMLAGNAPENGKGNWTADKPEITFLNPVQFNTMISNLHNGPNTLWWTISNTNCQSVDSVVILAHLSVEIVNQPTSQEIDEGGNTSFILEVSGDIENIQWQKDGVDLVNDNRISGVNDATLNITDLIMSEAGNYQCIINGYCNALISEVAALSVISGYEDLSQNGINIYPNPSKGIVYLDFDNALKYKNLSISSMSGKKVFYKQNLDKIEIVDLTNFADGIYLITILNDKRLIRSKLILQK